MYLVSGVLSAGYLFPIVLRAFMRTSPDHTRYGEADMRMVVPLAITGVLALVLGVLPDTPFHFYNLAQAVADSASSLNSAVAGGVQ